MREGLQKISRTDLQRFKVPKESVDIRLNDLVVTI